MQSYDPDYDYLGDPLDCNTMTSEPLKMNDGLMLIIFGFLIILSPLILFCACLA